MTLNRNGLTAIVPLLTEQHRQLAGLLDAVDQAAGPDRLLAFNDFRRYLAAHEAAEEEAVHPAARTGAGGVVEQRLAEEYQAGKLITDLEQLDVDSHTFTSQFATLKSAVTAHAHREETDEFPALVDLVDTQTLIRVHHIVKQVETFAALTDPDQPFVLQTEHHRQRFRGTADAGQL